jgi:hypothetical protein
MSVSWSLSFVGHKNEKKYNNEHRFIIIFFGCIETKQKKTMTNANLSSSSLGPQKKNKRR